MKKYTKLEYKTMRVLRMIKRLSICKMIITNDLNNDKVYMQKNTIYTND